MLKNAPWHGSWNYSFSGWNVRVPAITHLPRTKGWFIDSSCEVASGVPWAKDEIPWHLVDVGEWLAKNLPSWALSASERQDFGSKFFRFACICIQAPQNKHNMRTSPHG